MKIECIKGFIVGDNGDPLPILQGEVFKLKEGSDLDEILFEGLEGASLSPGMEIEFTHRQLCENFKLVVGR